MISHLKIFSTNYYQVDHFVSLSRRQVQLTLESKGSNNIDMDTLHIIKFRYRCYANYSLGPLK